MAKEIIDLRTALSALEEIPGQLVSTDVEVDPAAELAGNRGLFKLPRQGAALSKALAT